MLKVYDTMARQKQGFKPIGKKVLLYTCGPSVYRKAHIGNFRTFVFEDVLRRYLEFSGYKVRHAMNVTDVEEKSIRTGKGSKKRMLAACRRNERKFFKDLKRLGVKKPSVAARASENIGEMIRLIKKLERKGLAYEKDGSVFFDISRFPGYGRLSGKRLPEKAFKRRIEIEDYSQAQAGDFILWKARRKSDGSVWWESPWGKGRPGWHIECSAIALSKLGECIDIHAGGSDLVFAHHENEIAQSEGATGKKFVRYWVHARHLLVRGEKMSKRKGNIVYLDELARERKCFPKHLRFLYLSSHYRKRLNFTYSALEKACRVRKRLLECVEKLGKARGKGAGGAEGLAAEALAKMRRAMDDDLDTPKALEALEEMVFGLCRLLKKRQVGRKEAGKALEAIKKFDEVLGVVY